MPELPEVETIRAGLAEFLNTHRTISHITLNRQDLRFAFPHDFAKRMQGATITDFNRHGKYLLLHLNNGLVWLTHFGMSGHVRLSDNVADFKPPHHHVIASFTDAQQKTHKHMCYYDARRFGFMDLMAETNMMQENRFLRKLGRDPITQNINGAHLQKLAQGKKQNIKAFMMEQKNIAGMGNIYCSESLWLSKIHPARLCDALSSDEWDLLSDAMIENLRKAIKSGGSSFSDFSHPNGGEGYFQHEWQAYGRDGEVCRRCQTTNITRIIQQQRASFFCASCQH